MLRQTCPDLIIPDVVWHERWILHVTAWGNGEHAVLDDLARYVFRVALTNARIVGLDDETATIRYKERKTGGSRTCRLSGHESMRRFLQHVLPRGFHKVRCFGLWHPAQRRPAEANVATSGHTEVRSAAGLRCAAAHAIRREAATVDRAADLPALSGAVDLHRALSPRQAIRP